MKRPADPGARVWPSIAQEHLLKAALGNGPAAHKHYLAWAALTDLDGPIDEGTYRTLPLLWANMTRLGIEHPWLGRFKGVFRNSWVTSTRQLALASEVIGALEGEGIATLVSKGLPVSLLFYDRPALRPMNDLDIIVHPRDVRRASHLLEERGFAASRDSWDIDFALRHALMHRHPEQGEVDLHWHVLFEMPRGAADRHFWSAAVPIRIGEAQTLRPSTTDMLLHILVHGVRWNLSPPMRWIPDALAIMRSDEAIDWDRLARFAKSHRVGGRVAMALSYLAEHFDAQVPSGVVASLARTTSTVERLEHVAMRGRDERSAWRHLRRATYLLRLLGSDHKRRLPLALAGELTARVRRRRVRRKAAP